MQPTQPIVGKIRGKEIVVCKGDAGSQARFSECFPSGRQQLWLGDIIDFSWGLMSGQSGALNYVVWPSVTV